MGVGVDRVGFARLCAAEPRSLERGADELEQI